MEKYPAWEVGLQSFKILQNDGSNDLRFIKQNSLNVNYIAI